LPLQIRALRKQFVGTQPELSRLTGMKQSRISNMEKPGKVHFSLETLQRLAEAFDVALIVRFAPFSELLDWSDRFNPESFQVPSFTEELDGSAAPAQPEKVAETRVNPFANLPGGLPISNSVTFERLAPQNKKNVLGFIDDVDERKGMNTVAGSEWRAIPISEAAA